MAYVNGNDFGPCQNRGFVYIARRAIKVRVSCPVTPKIFRVEALRRGLLQMSRHVG